jgi:mono/diheme cytochrome c family protein
VKYVVFCIAALFLLANAACAAERAPLHYPSSAANLPRGALAVACERSGSVFLVEQGRIKAERTVGQRLVDIIWSPPLQRVIAVDASAGELIMLARKDGKLVENGRIRVSDDPQSVVGFSNYLISVSRWSRKLDVVVYQGGEHFILERSLELPFAARQCVLLPDGHVLVADAFGGQLALVDFRQRRIVWQREIHAHNISALAWDHDNNRLLIAHQILNSRLPVDFDNVQWGAVMKNVVRIVSREQLFDEKVNLNTATRVISLGQEGDGSADPTAVVPLADGGFAVTLGGANELVFVESTGIVTGRLQMGQRPLALVKAMEERELIAVNQFDQSLSIIDMARRAVTSTIPLVKETPKLTPAERGEVLFYDARLSFEKWMSCHSCHPDGHTNGQLADTLGDGSYGAPKRTLTLLGSRDTDRWAWNGEIKELHEQIRKSVTTSMQGTATEDELFDLTAFLHTLEPPPPLLPARDKAEDELIEQGRSVFQSQRCNTCHIAPLTYTSHDVYDVGLADEKGNTKFSPPSLRGVGQLPRLFHDNRADSLEEVFDVHDHQLREPLSDADRTALLRFLRSL